VAPVDGVIVPMRTSPGTFAIATDTTLLCAYAGVPQSDILSVRVGEAAEIEVDGLPKIRFDADVSAMADVPVDSPDGPAFLVVLAVRNPEGRQFAGQQVRIVLHTRL